MKLPGTFALMIFMLAISFNWPSGTVMREISQWTAFVNLFFFLVANAKG